MLHMVASSLVWLWMYEGVRPDRWDLVGAMVCVLGDSSCLDQDKWPKREVNGVVHGWYYSVDDTILDAPKDPKSHIFADKIGYIYPVAICRN